jgi:hypothetical protein
MWKEWFRMGHMIDYFEFRKTKDLKEDKNTIYGEVSEWGEYESDARDYHGNLKFKTDTVFDNREKAKEYLERYEGKYEDVAVIYKEFEDKETVKIKRLKEKVKTLAKQRGEYKQKNLLGNRKSKTITCPKCKSVLNISYLTSYNEERHNCPLCAEELLSNTVVERKRKFLEDMSKINKEIKKEIEKENKKQENFKLRWLVKAEVHC